ncbi:hypothetical protein [Endothiovibrio diazotrophicus]
MLVATWIVSLSPPAMAYVGPGAGITLLGSLGAVISFLAIAAGGLLAWPIRMLRQKLKKGRSEADRKDAPDETSGE